MAGDVFILGGKRTPMTQYVGERFERFDLVGAYAASMVLALLAVGTLAAMNLFKPKEGS